MSLEQDSGGVFLYIAFSGGAQIHLLCSVALWSLKLISQLSQKIIVVTEEFNN